MAIQFERDLDIGNNKIRNLDNPVARSDAATKGYVDDLAVPVISFAMDIGDGSNTVFDVDHNLGTEDVWVTLFDNATGEEVDTDVGHLSDARIRLIFGSPPGTAEFRCVVRAER